MCTVSIIRLDAPDQPSDKGRGALRIVCNRDESRTRPPAALPKWHPLGRARALWPMDLEAGGTWIAATERGIAFCLLNLNPQTPFEPRGSLHSRGLIIPHLVGSTSIGAAAEALMQMRLKHFAPFRLIGVDPGGDGTVVEARWDGSGLGLTWHAGPPLCFVSSGLGDALVAPRLDLFEELVAEPGPTPERQDEFHRHTWPDRPELSVLMSRADARTVSIVTLEILPGPERPSVQMGYEAIPTHTKKAAPALAQVSRP